MPKLTKCATCIHNVVCINGVNHKCAEDCIHYINEDAIKNLREELFEVRQNSVHINTLKILLNEKKPAPVATDTSNQQ